MALRQKIRFCTASDGVRLAYASVGNGPPLVKAPNWLTHIELELHNPIWRHWIEALSQRFSYARYDARGCGLSDRDPPDLSFESWVRDLEAVVDALGLERFPLLGLSGGGPIAIAYATRHPERVSQLILYGSFARGRAHRNPEALEEGQLLYKLMELGWGRRDPSFRHVFAKQFVADATPELVEAFDRLQCSGSSASDALRMMQVSMQVDVTREARAIRCPTLIMHATEDVRIPFEEGRVLAGLIPDARFVPLESRNHILLEGEPAWARFLEEVEAFVPGVRAVASFPALTTREREVLDFVARGMDNHQIAAHLGISEKTVRNVVSSVLDKLQVESRAQAIVRARDSGYGMPSTA
ncbi:MAG TPA: alpha/beta fold hydrolase [Usitatibacter sp.]|nr:alpha/beta fold hydrolase [Usitatibacter sp.]